VIDGDATLDATLETAGLERAKGLAACLRDDADNVFLCLTARAMNPKLEIAARAAHEESVSKLRRAGANHVVSPNVTGGARMAATLLRPSVVSFLDATTLAHDSSLRLEEKTVPAGSHLAGKRLAEARIPQETGLVVIGLQQGGRREVVYNPGPETTLQAGDTMIVLGLPEQIRKLSGYVLR
jgi:voltage-gated potassium channel